MKSCDVDIIINNGQNIDVVICDYFKRRPEVFRPVWGLGKLLPDFS